MQSLEEVRKAMFRIILERRASTYIIQAPSCHLQELRFIFQRLRTFLGTWMGGVKRCLENLFFIVLQSHVLFQLQLKESRVFLIFSF